ncbi:MAG: sodium-dependent bicarbonate transport family permease [Thaumarchaeota archaeon]|nr:sodium-dependent bicarbonate transport family permease [Nitrososphaerota archaeon]
MEIIELIQANILTPVVLFFILGMVAARIKSDLKIPDAISEFLPIYLLAAIGLHGGLEMRKTGFESMLIPMLTAIALSLVMTLNHYQILRKLGKFNVFDSYALASTYGAVGAVTFSVGLSFLKNRGIESEGYITAILAVLEPLAFILAIFLTNMAVAKQVRAKKQAFTKNTGKEVSIDDSLDTLEVGQTKTKLFQVLRESITGKAIVILIGSIVIGYVIGKEGFIPIKLLFEDLFAGAIVIFLIEMGIIAGQRLDDVRKVGAFLIGFALVIPTVNGIVGVLVASYLGLSVGGAVMFGLLLASASFIAAPAVLRAAIPQAKPSLYITSALGITFPYNIIILLPIMLTVSSLVHNPGTIDLFNYLGYNLQ